MINGGVYLLDRGSFLEHVPPAGAFSLETDFFAGNAARLNFQGLLFDVYFIDIGVPDDYRRAQHEFADFRY